MSDSHGPNRPPIPRSSLLLGYTYLIVLVITVLIGAPNIVLSIISLLSGNLDGATRQVTQGVLVLVVGYITSVVLAFIITKKWQWKPIVTFQRVDKK